MVSLITLPDDILAAVLQEAFHCNDSSTSDFPYVLSLLAVCRRLRTFAILAAYRTVFVKYNESACHGRYDRALPASELANPSFRTNLGLVASAGCAQVVRHVNIEVDFSGFPIHGFGKTVQLMRIVSPAWKGVRSLKLDIVTGDRAYDDTPSSLDANADTFQEIDQDLATVLPNVRHLAFGRINQAPSVEALCKRMLGTYARQLHSVGTTLAAGMPDGMVLEQVRSLDVHFTCTTRGLLLRVRPHALEVLRLRELRVDHSFPIIGADSKAQTVVFPRLRSLVLHYSGGQRRRQPKDRRVLWFPVLEHFRLWNWTRYCPFLGQAKFPSELKSMSIDASPSVLGIIAEMPVAVTGRVMFGAGSPHDEPGALAQIGRILGKAQDRSRVELSTGPHELLEQLNQLEHGRLTSLHVGAQTCVDAVIEVIPRLPNLVNLVLGRLELEGTQMDISAPGPGEPAPSPLSTTLRTLSIVFHNWWHVSEQAVPLIQYLLLRTPALAKLTLDPPPPVQPLAEFFAEYSARYPSLARARMRGPNTDPFWSTFEVLLL